MNFSEFICCNDKNEHIVNDESFITTCGGYACKTCLSSENNINCRKCQNKIHGITNIEIKSIGLIAQTLKINRNIFEEHLIQKFKYQELIRSLNTEQMNSIFKEKCDNICNEIDIYIDSLKTELDNFRTIWLMQIEELKNYFSINIEEMQDIHVELTSNENDTSYQEKIQIIENQLQIINSKLPKIQFHPLTNNFEIQKIGELIIKVK